MSFYDLHGDCDSPVGVLAAIEETEGDASRRGSSSRNPDASCLMALEIRTSQARPTHKTDQWPLKKIGRCFLVGAGPAPRVGHVASKGIRQADLIVYDYLSIRNNSAGLAGPAGSSMSAEAVRIRCRRIKSMHSGRKKAGAGNQVVRLKGGDPFVFGRGGEEAAAPRKQNSI